MKRIAMISYHTCPLASLEGKETGGMNVYVLELSKELAKKGYQVDIFTRSQDVNNEHVVNVAPNLRVIHVTAGPQKSLSKKHLMPYMDEFVREIEKFAKDEGISYLVLHAHYYLSGLIGLKLRESFPKLPMVMSFHTLALLKNLVARSAYEQEDEVRINAEMTLTKEADMIITTSTTDASYMQYLYGANPDKLACIPPGIDIKNFYPIEKSIAKKKIGLEGKEKIILFVGRIEPLKGIDALIYAVKIISEQKPDLPIRLIIVGGDISQKKSEWAKELQQLEILRQTLHIPDIVTFVGQRSQEELLYYYNSAELVVMPSHYESFGMVALEAMACGVPVITSNVSGVAGIIDEKHASLITTVNNPLLLATQIERLLTDEAVHQKVSRDVRANVEDLSWENIACDIGNVYDGLCKINYE